MSLAVRPITLRAANAFVERVHRHHGASRGHKFSVSVVDETGEVRGVAIAGRPLARRLDDGETLEVLRVATDGAGNACSMLYGACARVGVAMGYRRSAIITYTLENELGVSLRAAGWVPVALTDGGSWSRSTRQRTDKHPTCRKIRWHAASVDAPAGAPTER